MVLQGLSDFSGWYFDEILIHSKILEDHKVHLQQVFDRLRKHVLKLKLKKCSFLQTETAYLGFVNNKDGINPDENKVANQFHRLQVYENVDHLLQCVHTIVGVLQTSQK